MGAQAQPVITAIATQSEPRTRPRTPPPSELFDSVAKRTCPASAEKNGSRVLPSVDRHNADGALTLSHGVT